MTVKVSTAQASTGESSTVEAGTGDSSTVKASTVNDIQRHALDLALCSFQQHQNWRGARIDGGARIGGGRQNWWARQCWSWRASCCNVSIGCEGCLANGGPQGPIYGQNRQRTASNRLLESHRKQSSNGLQHQRWVFLRDKSLKGNRIPKLMFSIKRELHLRI